MGWGMGMGIGWAAKSMSSIVKGIVDTFKAYVLGVGGTFEAESCLKGTLNKLDTSGLLNKATLITTPNGFKSSRLYSVIPGNTAGDMSYVRATTATRVNSAGLVEIVATNTPRINYDTADGCPSVLTEPQATNVLTWSEAFDNPSWINNGCIITANSTTSPSGALNADLLTGTSGGFGIVKFSTWTATNKTASCYAKIGSTNLFKIENGSNGANCLFNLSTQVVTNSNGFSGTMTYIGNGWYRCVAVDTLARTGTFSVGVNAANESVYIWGAQLGAGPTQTSYIPTTSAAVTRNTDLITKSNLYTNGFITSAGGTWFIHLNNNVPLFRTAGGGTGISLSTTSSGNPTSGLCIRHPSGTAQLRLTIFSNYNGLGYGTMEDNCKLALKWDGTTLNIFENGIKVRNNIPFTVTQMEFFRTNDTDIRKFCKSNILFPMPLTDEECINLTTL